MTSSVTDAAPCQPTIRRNQKHSFVLDPGQPGSPGAGPPFWNCSPRRRSCELKSILSGAPPVPESPGPRPPFRNARQAEDPARESILFSLKGRARGARGTTTFRNACLDRIDLSIVLPRGCGCSPFIRSLYQCGGWLEHRCVQRSSYAAADNGRYPLKAPSSVPRLIRADFRLISPFYLLDSGEMEKAQTPHFRTHTPSHLRRFADSEFQGYAILESPVRDIEP